MHQHVDSHNSIAPPNPGFPSIIVLHFPLHAFASSFRIIESMMHILTLLTPGCLHQMYCSPLWMFHSFIHLSSIVLIARLETEALESKQDPE